MVKKNHDKLENETKQEITSSGGSRSLSTIVFIIAGSTTSQLWSFWKACANIGRMSICITTTK